MKLLSGKSIGAILGLTLLSVSPLIAETTVQTTSTTSAGTISEFGPDIISIKSETTSDPIRYRYSKTTTYVDENGSPVSMETVKSGLPVTVYYAKEGDQMIASKVVVRKTSTTAPVIEEKKTSTTTTTTDSK